MGEMKFTVKYLSIVLFLLISVLCISFAGQKAGWKGTIDTKGGIKIIRNPAEPLYGEFHFILQGLAHGGRQTRRYLCCG
jgi:hypothetical protein